LALPIGATEERWMQLLRLIETERLNISEQLTTTEQQLQTVREKLLSIETSSGILEARLQEREKMLELALEQWRQRSQQLSLLEEQLSAREGTYESLRQSFDDYSAAAKQKIHRLTLTVVTEGIVIGGLLYAIIRITAGN